ncbi:MAG: UvrD-helicase domain-containing protein [Parcubacteria group bacterium]|nr:UvrD-helicase domain-containing protein [Parcubacteria group bacterium]
MDASLHGLNPAQKEAVLHKEGPLLVVAGAGAGKTRVVTCRIAELLRSGVSPERILAVTFTNKAANEMRERVSLLMRTGGGARVTGYGNDPADFPFIGTFHSLGVHILREKGGAIGIKKHFTIKDRDDSKSLIRHAMKNVGADPKQYEPGKMLAHISRMKGDLVTVDEYEKRYGGDASFGARFSYAAARVWREYDALLAREGALDFDDLLLSAVLLLQKNAAALAHFQDRWSHIHIDEYQDTNHAQYMLAKLLAEKHGNVCAVGDTDQLIYSWRGARIKNILRFEKDYPNTKIVFLEENYRSTKTILDAANEVIQKNTLRQKKTLFTQKPRGEKLSLFVAPNEMAEAYYAAARARELIGRKNAAPHDIAMLYRTNFQSRALEEACLALDVPYVVLGTRFFERKEIKDVFSYIRAAVNPESLGDVKRIINMPPRGVGTVTIVKIFSGQKNALPPKIRGKIDDFYALLKKIEIAAREKTPAELVSFVAEHSGLTAHLESEGGDGFERLQNVKELGSLASRYRDLDKFLEDAALASDQDALVRDGKGVRLMTVHAAKGLEFPYVFVTGLEQGLFPSETRAGADSARTDAEKQEEERRLFYVALTRAKEKVFLSYAETRSVFGSRGLNAPSEFLADIPQELVELETANEEEIMPNINI